MLILDLLFHSSPFTTLPALNYVQLHDLGLEVRVTCNVRPTAAYDPVRHLSTCPHLVFDLSGYWRLILHLVRVGALSIAFHISVRIGLILHLSQPCPHQHYSILLKNPISAWKTYESSTGSLTGIFIPASNPQSSQPLATGYFSTAGLTPET